MKAITKKSENISGWYNDLVFAAKLAEHGPSKGSIIIRPYGYALWEAIQGVLDRKIKGLGAQNAYFPLFIPYSFLEKEKSHVEGFSPELAVVTHGGGEKLTEPLVVRPTSETIMYDSFSRWISSFRDLPLLINQWSNVVRWEKRPYLFLRTTEFLWQEGHTAHATKEEAEEMAQKGIKMYRDLYENTLALFGYTGRKSETEKFAGAEKTLTFEMLMPDGKALQGCTSHDLGQNFSKVFKVKFQTKEGKEEFVYQTSWGFTTRSIGALILAHGDDRGLILPPQIAPIQVVIIPIVSKGADKEGIEKLAQEAFDNLKNADLRVELDNSDNSPGWKFNQYELEGVPLRIEIGSSEVRDGKVSVKMRDQETSTAVSVGELPGVVKKSLEEMQKRMFERSKSFTHQNTRQADTYEEFKKIMGSVRGFIEAFWCESAECEQKIKQETKANSRCLPEGAVKANGKCIYCGKEASYRWLFAQSY